MGSEHGVLVHEDCRQQRPAKPALNLQPTVSGKQRLVLSTTSRLLAVMMANRNCLKLALPLLSLDECITV